MTTLTQEQRNRISGAIDGCSRYIDKESPRNPDLRPKEIQDLLDWTIKHRAALIQRLENNV